MFPTLTMLLRVVWLLPTTGFAKVLSATQARGLRSSPDNSSLDLLLPVNAVGETNQPAYEAVAPHLGSAAYHSRTCTKEVRQTLTNGDDVIFTMPIAVGGQDMKAIPDTGSFSLLVFSNKCTVCSAPDAYDQQASPTFRSDGFQAEQNFGSGSATGVEAFDSISFGDMHVDQQVFWEVVDADAGFQEMTFGAILGVGPPRSNVVMCEQELQYIDRELAIKNKAGSYDKLAYGDVKKHFRDMLSHAKTQTMVVNQLEMCTYSMCLPMQHGQDGVWIWNDQSPMTESHHFSSVPVNGDVYWSADLGDVMLSGGIIPAKTPLGCHSKKCSAVVDTGTSLLVVPTDAYNGLVSAVNQWGCTDLNNLPDIELVLGGRLFTLPPESYVGELYGELPTGARKLMPHAARQLDAQQANTSLGSCSLLVMTIDEESPKGKVWILGLPWFRKYYTSFELSTDYQTAYRMHFAEKDQACNPTSAQGLNRQNVKRGISMRLDASKIRTPRHRPAPQKAAELLRQAHLASAMTSRPL